MKLRRFSARASSFLLLTAALGSLEFTSVGQLTRIQSGDLQLTLRRSADGIGADSLLDRRSGQELLATNPASLFSIALRQPGSTNGMQVIANAGWGNCAVEKHGKRLELRWSRPTDASLAGLAVAITVSPDAAASAFRWKLRVNNANTNWSVWQVTFPELVLSDLGSNAAVLYPQGPGIVQRGVWHRAFRYGGEYPGGWCSMQFMAAYREGDQPTGLYLAMHDPWASTKDLAVKSDPAAHTVRMSFSHPAPNMGLVANAFVLEGEAVWQLLRGDWFDAATIYKQWASREAKWWPRLTRDGRSDTPRWARDLDAWVMTGGAPADCVQQVKGFREFLGMPVGFHWYNWHQIPFDNDYPHYFPTKEGFAQGVSELKAAGAFVMPYINGRLWDTHDRGPEDFEFTRLALAAATKQADGSPYVERYNSKETNGQSVSLGVMCPSTPLWQNTVSNIVLRLLRECGTDGVYIDQVAAAAPKLCMDRAHGHPLGGGHWWNEGYWKMLADMRRAMPQGTILTTECNSEPFIRWFDEYLTWHWQFDGQVPAFPAIYGGTVQMFGRAFRGGNSNSLALRMKTGQQLVFGEQLGWLDPGLLKEQENAEFLRQMARLRAKFSRCFSAGEMARPPRFVDAIPTVRADWQWSGEWWVSTDAVLSGAWGLPSEKRLILFFVNVSDQSLSARLHFDAVAYGIRARSLQAQLSTPDGSTVERQTWPTACDRAMVFAPRQAQAWELKW